MVPLIMILLACASMSLARASDAPQQERLNAAELGQLLFRAKEALLVASAAQNDEARALLLLKMPGINVNYADGSGKTALHHAAIHGMKELAKLLLELGANKNAEDAAGNKPIALAHSHGHADIVALL